MSSAKRISVEEVIQQIEDEDFDFFFKGSDEDFGLNSSSDDDNEIRTHCVPPRTQHSRGCANRGCVVRGHVSRQHVQLSFTISVQLMYQKFNCY